MKLHEISNPINHSDHQIIADELYNLGLDMRTCTINTDGSVDVNGNVLLPERRLTKIPVQFRIVHGEFNCADNPKLTSLKGCPQRVNGSFRCYNTSITSLQYAPRWISGRLVCFDTNIKSLSGVDKHIKHIEGHIVMPTTATHILGLLLIDGITHINVRFGVLDDIMNKYLGTKDILSCQDELIDAGFIEQARL